MSVEAQIEELRAELKACAGKHESRTIARELAALIEVQRALAGDDP